MRLFNLLPTIHSYRYNALSQDNRPQGDLPPAYTPHPLFDPLTSGSQTEDLQQVLWTLVNKAYAPDQHPSDATRNMQVLLQAINSLQPVKELTRRDKAYELVRPFTAPHRFYHPSYHDAEGNVEKIELSLFLIHLVSTAQETKVGTGLNIYQIVYGSYATTSLSNLKEGAAGTKKEVGILKYQYTLYKATSASWGRLFPDQPASFDGNNWLGDQHRKALEKAVMDAQATEVFPQVIGTIPISEEQARRHQAEYQRYLKHS